MNWLRKIIRPLTRWAHEPEYSMGRAAMELMVHYQELLETRTAQLKLLEELFREKQGKISRLQACYTNKTRPLYEDLRKEQPIKDAESLAQSISVLAQRAESCRARTGKRMNISDGTVQGVPGDKPNLETGDGW